MPKYIAIILSLLVLGTVSTHAFSAAHATSYDTHDFDKKKGDKGDDDGGDDDGEE